MAATDAKSRLGAILDLAQREPVLIRRQNRDIAVLMSVDDYDRLRGNSVHAFLEARSRVAAQAESRGLTEERLAALLTDDDA